MSRERLRFLLLGRSDGTFGSEWLRAALAPTIVFLTLPAANDLYWWLSFLLPVPTLFAWLRTRGNAVK
jgi:hypothetical protein